MEIKIRLQPVVVHAFNTTKHTPNPNDRMWLWLCVCERERGRSTTEEISLHRPPSRHNTTPVSQWLKKTSIPVVSFSVSSLRYLVSAIYEPYILLAGCCFCCSCWYYCPENTLNPHQAQCAYTVVIVWRMSKTARPELCMLRTVCNQNNNNNKKRAHRSTHNK